MSKTTITISKDLRNRIRHSKNVTFSGGYEDFLSRLMDRDKRFSNKKKHYTNKENLKTELGIDIIKENKELQKNQDDYFGKGSEEIE